MLINFISFRIPTTVETETNRQLLLKLKKNEYGELTSSASTNEYINGHNNSPFNSPTKQENQAPIQPHITNMLSNLNDDKKWNSNHISQPATTVRYIFN